MVVNILPAPCPDKTAYEQMLNFGFLKYPERKENYLICKSVKKAAIVNYLPIKMDYEVTSRCNFRCIMCMVQNFKGGKRAEDMTFENFKRSLDDLYGLTEIKLQGLGEPLLNGDLFKMLSYASEQYIWTRTTTNGSLLHINDNFMRLIDSNPGEVQVSIDGATKDVYEKIRRGSNFELVVKNTTLLNEYAGSLGLLKTRCWTVVQKYNENQLFEIIQLADKMKFRRLTFSITLADYANEELGRSNKSLDAAVSFEKGQELIDYGMKYGIDVTFWDGTNKYSLGNKDHICAWIFERAYISSDMKVVPCCVISVPDVYNFGNALDFRNVWNNEMYIKLRESHLAATLPDFCKRCYE